MRSLPSEQNAYLPEGANRPPTQIGFVPLTFLSLRTGQSSFFRVAAHPSSRRQFEATGFVPSKLLPPNLQPLVVRFFKPGSASFSDTSVFAAKPERVCFSDIEYRRIGFDPSGSIGFVPSNGGRTRPVTSLKVPSSSRHLSTSRRFHLPPTSLKPASSRRSLTTPKGCFACPKGTP